MTLQEEIVQASITPEKIVKSFQNIVKILDLEKRPAMTFEVKYKGDEYSATLDMNAVKIDEAEVSDNLWDRIRESNITSEILLKLVEKLIAHLEEKDLQLYKIPVPIGLKPLTQGCSFSLDLRVYKTEEE